MFQFDNSYSRLPQRFFANVSPTTVERPEMVYWNEPLAASLGFDAEGAATPQERAHWFSGNKVLPGATPIAMAYAGHQFGHFVPQLGDGRAILLGEVIDTQGTRRDIQLKGSGPTPFSRRGDGRAALGPVVREYIMSEAMHALGIKTTRALAAVLTGETVVRESLMPGGVITRVAESHIRVGSFQYFAGQNDIEGLKRLADYTIERLYPDAREAENPYLGFLRQVIDAQAKLIASWMHVGFIHGVMNTDNMAISGETIDYGPCAFMDVYDPATVFSSIDAQGRYAFGNQVPIALWNLARFAETLLPFIDDDSDRAIGKAEPLLNAFSERYKKYWLDGMRRKFGLFTQAKDDQILIEGFLQHLHEKGLDYTISFRQLADLVSAENEQGLDRVWFMRWQQRMNQEPQSTSQRVELMNAVNPYVIPRNYHIEQAISAAVERGDFSPMEKLNQILSRPFEFQPDNSMYAGPPPPMPSYRTFCGT